MSKILKKCVQIGIKIYGKRLVESVRVGPALFELGLL